MIGTAAAAISTASIGRHRVRDGCLKAVSFGHKMFDFIEANKAHLPPHHSTPLTATCYEVSDDEQAALTGMAASVQ